MLRKRAAAEQVMLAVWACSSHAVDRLSGTSTRSRDAIGARPRRGVGAAERLSKSCASKSAATPPDKRDSDSVPPPTDTADPQLSRPPVANSNAVRLGPSRRLNVRGLEMRQTKVGCWEDARLDGSGRRSVSSGEEGI